MDKLLIKLVCSAKPLKVTDINKYTILLRNGINYGRNHFYDTGPAWMVKHLGACTIKLFTAVIYGFLGAPL